MRTLFIAYLISEPHVIIELGPHDIVQIWRMNMERTHPLNSIRNIGIVAHIDAGKTTTTERILFYTGLIHKMGEVHQGSAVMDWMEQEQERGITITSAATSCLWKQATINIMDTPGHVDFTVEVERCLRVLDGAVFLLDAKEAVEAQTETVWHQADHYNVPRLVFVNKMDIIGADYKRCIHQLKSRLKGTPLPLQIPMGSEKTFEGVISLVDMKGYLNTGPYGEVIETIEIPSAYLEEAKEYEQIMLEMLSDFDEDLMQLYLEGQNITAQRRQLAIRAATLSGKVVPVLCGTAYRNKGIQLLLDAIVDYLPSPLDKTGVCGLDLNGESTCREVSDTAPFTGLIFKIMSDPFVGKLTYVRVYSGTVKAGEVLLNPAKGKRERIQKILHMHANTRQEVSQAFTGDVIAMVGLKHATTGDTLCDMDGAILLETMDFPKPVISIALESKTPGDLIKMQVALERLCEEDPTLKTDTHPETDQILISGMGELHLEIILDRLAKEFGVLVNSGKPQVAYKETIEKPVIIDYTLDRHTGAQLLFAKVQLSVKPNPQGLGNTIDIKMVNEKWPQTYLEACKEGILQSLLSGFIGGYEVVDVNVTITGLSCGDHGTEIALKTAGALALSEALEKATSVLLEPYFNLEVHVPEPYVGEVVEDLNKRKSDITDIAMQPSGRLICATAPLSNLFGYATDLRSKTQGRGQYTMIFSHYGRTK